MLNPFQSLFFAQKTFLGLKMSIDVMLNVMKCNEVHMAKDICFSKNNAWNGFSIIKTS